MFILKLILYFVLFIFISRLIQWSYKELKKNKEFSMSWLGYLFLVLTIIIWMIVPDSWINIMAFAVTYGVFLGERENVPQKRRLF